MITLEEYLMRTKAAAQEQGLIGAEETDRIAKLFEESEKMGRDPANNKIAESMTIATESTQIFLDTFEAAADGVARGTQDMSQAFESMAKSIILQIAKLLATQGIGMFLSGQGGFLGDVGTALLTNAKGNAFSDGNVVPMAKGGVVTGPTLFPMANGVGLMGEKGAEAVMPLSRDSSGRLGVSGGGMNVTVNNMAAGVEVTPRQDDDGLTIDVVLASVAADVRRGGNVVSEAIEQTYSMGRGRGVY
jgi:phage-related minor tail protein